MARRASGKGAVHGGNRKGKESKEGDKREWSLETPLEARGKRGKLGCNALFTRIV